MQHSPLLQVALEAVHAAEEIMLHYFDAHPTVELKENLTPVTIADRECEIAIKQIIGEAFPEHGFFGEEFGKDESDAEYNWIIDPIDGTKEFLRGMPFFGTQLALVKGSEFLIGVSHAPKLQETVYAEKGYGSYINDEPIRVSGIADLSEAYLLTGGVKYFSRTNTVGPLLQLAERVRGNRVYGSPISYPAVAQGKADAMIEMDVPLWDIAAAVAIVTEAGGRFTMIDGNPLQFQEKASILASNGLIHDQILSYFNA